MSAFATIAAYTSPWDAHIARGRLESEGIPVFIAHENHVWLNWMYSHALGGVKLQVASIHTARACEILTAIRDDQYRDALRKQFPDIDELCPQCGTDRFKNIFSMNTIMLILFMYFCAGIIFPARKDVRTCLDCGHEWIS